MIYTLPESQKKILCCRCREEVIQYDIDNVIDTCKDCDEYVLRLIEIER